MQLQAMLKKCYITYSPFIVHKILMSSYLHLHYFCREWSAWLWLGTASCPDFDDRQSDGMEIGSSWQRFLSTIQAPN